MKKLIYLISPEKIYSDFYKDLNKVLETRKIKFFQLRLKKISRNKTIKIAKKIMKITKIHKVNFLINDSFKIAKIINADGCHLGQLDGSVTNAKKSLKNKIIGVTCHNSKLLAKTAIKNKASYVAFGSFGKSLLKPTARKADLKILKWAKKNIKKPIVAIGGINNSNYKKLIKAGANYIAISSYIWDNPELKPEFAIRKFK
ncbi:thiamine phosphate synthase [Pelagibacteraceae bacterium]|nr:thiamine phosphate synthase [Pelagibacteraceae bacterium]